MRTYDVYDSMLLFQEEIMAKQQPLQVKGLMAGLQYQLVWVQVSQYNDAFHLDLLKSDHFIAM